MAVRNSLVTQAKKQTFSAYLTQDAIKHKINQMVGGKDGQRFITSMISAVSVNPSLSECDFSTILSAAMLGESLKLSPSPQLGQYYLVPFNDKKRGCKVATFVLGYKGYIQMAKRTGVYKKIIVLPIKEGELISYDPMDEEIVVSLIDDEGVREEAPTAGYYAKIVETNGFEKAMYWSKKKMMIHADKYSAAFSAGKYDELMGGKIPASEAWKYSSFWYKDFDDMAMKTMLRQLISRWGTMSIEMQAAYERDDSLLNEDGSFEYVASVEDMPMAQEVPVIDTTAVEASAEQEDDPFDNLFNAGA